MTEFVEDLPTGLTVHRQDDGGLLLEVRGGAGGLGDAQWRDHHGAVRYLIAFGGDGELYDRGEVFAADRTVSATSDWGRVNLYEASHSRSAR